MRNKTIAALLLIIAALVLGGCGIRNRVPEGEPPCAETVTEQEEDLQPDENDQPAEDPESDKKQFDENSSSSINDEASNSIAPTDNKQDDSSKDQPPAYAGSEGKSDNLTATETVITDQSDNKGVDRNGQTADSMMEYYQTLLTSRLSDQFECKKLYIYWECSEDYLTIHKSSAEHSIILLSGSYDHSAKLQPDALNVDDGWVCRKNPEAIVKVLPAAQIAGKKFDASHSETAAQISSRPGWDQISAVKNGHILVISEDLIKSPNGQTLAAVFVAKSLYPSLMEDVDLAQAAEDLK